MSRHRWIFVSVMCAVVLVLGGLYFYMPYRALEKINASLEEGNPLGVAMGITSHELQAQLVSQERRKMEQALAQGQADSPYLLLGPAMAPLMAERMAWERVSSSSLRGQLLTPDGVSVFRGAATSFDGPSRLVVMPASPNAPTLVLVRQGFGWETESIQLAD